MPLARRKRVEGVSRFGRDSVAIRSRFGVPTSGDTRGDTDTEDKVPITSRFGRDSAS